MKQIVEKIPELYNALEDKIKETDSLKAKLILEDGEAKELRVKLVSKRKELTVREVKVSKVEDVVALDKKVKEDTKGLKANLAQLKIEKDAFESYQEIAKKEHIAKMKTLDDLKEKIEAQNKKSKAQLVSEVMKEIGNKIVK